tara:strand:+ start:1104 stop:1418 length:315 start_codon:yes stop_codon:yes gene_type:complete
MIKNINYSKKMESAILARSPITYDIASELAEIFGKTLRSVIAKSCSMEGVVYVARERVAKNGSDICRKSDLVDEITRALASDEDLTGLVKAPKSALENLLMSIS